MRLDVRLLGDEATAWAAKVGLTAEDVASDIHRARKGETRAALAATCRAGTDQGCWGGVEAYVDAVAKAALR